ncbi:MAG: hypothetical protein ABSF09_02730 [Candidatus Bathyarchaeia archaeon]
MSGPRGLGCRQVFQVTIATATIISAAITIVDSYNTRGIVWQAIETGEPLLVALILLQTHWFLFGIFFLIGITRFHHRKELTRNRAMWTGIGTLIASFLVTWGVRASYFGITGHNYPGQDLLEFRLETGVAGLLIFLFGVLAAMISIFAEEGGPEEMYLMHDYVHTTECQVVQHKMVVEAKRGKTRPQARIHFGLPKTITDCECPCHRIPRAGLIVHPPRKSTQLKETTI